MSSPVQELDLLAVIPGENPAGNSLRGTPAYEQIRKARRPESSDGDAGGKGSTPSRVSRLHAIIEPSTRALATQSKDLQIAVWLTDALISRDGLEGLAEGLNLCRGLLDKFWDTLYPEAEGGDLEPRINLIEWLGKHDRHRLSDSPVSSVRQIPITSDGRTVTDYRNSLIPTSKGRDELMITEKEFTDSFNATPKSDYKKQVADLQASVAALDALEAVVDSRFGREAPSLRDLRTALEEMDVTLQALLSKKLEKDPDPVPTELPASAPPTAAPDQPAQPAETGTPDKSSEPQKWLTEPGAEPAQVIVAAAHALRRAAPADARSYLVLRALRWGELRSGGAELDDQLLSAPSTDVRKNLKSLANAGRWAELLETSETVVGTDCGRGWLDVQRYSVVACEKLGYTAAASAVKAELKSLLDTYPVLPSRTLADDTGTANPATSAWLSSGMKAQE